MLELAHCRLSCIGRKKRDSRAGRKKSQRSSTCTVAKHAPQYASGSSAEQLVTDPGCSQFLEIGVGGGVGGTGVGFGVGTGVGGTGVGGTGVGGAGVGGGVGGAGVGTGVGEQVLVTPSQQSWPMWS